MTSGSRWEASRRSSRSTTWTGPSGTRPPSAKIRESGRATCSGVWPNRFATGPLLHFGQGKWYPGESLPRWALGCFWRADGEPIWRNPALIAEDEHTYSFGEREAKAFVTRLAQRLGVEAGNATAGYEDAWYYLWKERRLPANVDPLKSNLADVGGADSLSARLRAGFGPSGRFHFALASPFLRERRPLGKRCLDVSHRAHVPDSGRLADGIPAAARFTPLAGRQKCQPNLRAGSRLRTTRRCRRPAGATPARDRSVDRLHSAGTARTSLPLNGPRPA